MSIPTLYKKLTDITDGTLVTRAKNAYILSNRRG